MKVSVLGIIIIVVGIFGIVLMTFFGKVTSTNDQNYYLLKEVTNSAMYDAIDLAAYRYGYIDEEGKEYEPGVIRIDDEKFVESFVRRYAESADIARNYKISIYEIMEMPPKVVIRVQYGEPLNLLKHFLDQLGTENYEFTISEDIAGILEETIK